MIKNNFIFLILVLFGCASCGNDKEDKETFGMEQMNNETDETIFKLKIGDTDVFEFSKIKK